MVNFFRDYKIQDPEDKKREARMTRNVLTNVDQAIEDSHEEISAPEDNDINHLYRSIDALDPENSEIDAKIIKRVTSILPLKDRGLDAKKRFVIPSA